LLQVCEEVLVADTGSKDDTISIAQKAGARVISLPWQGYAKTKNSANAAAQHHWILSIDADEVLSDELTSAIQNTHAQRGQAFRLSRFSNYCGTWIKYSGWYPDKKVRLFHRADAKWAGDYVHETLELKIDTKIIDWQGDLLHYTYKDQADHRQRIKKYALLAAQDRFNRGKKAKWYKLIFSPAVRFFRHFVIKRGFLDGQAGWQIARMEAYGVKQRYQQLQKLWQEANNSKK